MPGLRDQLPPASGPILGAQKDWGMAPISALTAAWQWPSALLSQIQSPGSILKRGLGNVGGGEQGRMVMGNIAMPHWLWGDKRESKQLEALGAESKHY